MIEGGLCVVFFVECVSFLCLFVVWFGSVDEVEDVL